jgi:F420-dependent oxidoreductase-like protein
MKIGLTVADFTWPDGPGSIGETLGAIAATAEEAGFTSISVMDHFFQIGMNGPPEHEMLEGYTTLGFLAGRTSTIGLGTLVTGVHYRHPGLLVKIVNTLDVLSGGRAWLGIGAGWNEEESRGLGVPFPPLASRFEEALRISRQMWDGDDRPFDGRHFQLDRPLNSPQVLRRPPVMIGGGGEKKTLRLVAQYADACNLFPPRDNVAAKLDVLRAHCEAEGRDYDSIEKTIAYQFDLGSNGERVGQTIDELAGYAELGIQTVHAAVAPPHDPAALELIGDKIIPAVAQL